MNEPPNLPIEALSMPAFKDRSAGLTVFGILTIVMGCLAGLMVLFMMLGLVVGANISNVPPTPVSSALMFASAYGGLAVALVWLGIGSIKARRWARALLLIFSWTWLVTGIIMVPIMGFVMPKTFANLPVTPGQPALPPGAITIMTIFMLLFMSFFFVVLPAIWVFFYGSRHVKATVERRDPVQRWTDACPLPVLGLSLWLGLGVPFMLFMPILGHGVVPFFGTFLRGFPGSLIYLVVAAVWACCAWRLYKLDVRAWWVVLVAMLLYCVSTLMTYTRHDVFEMYQLMGYPQDQIDQMKKLGTFGGNSVAWMLIFFVPFLGYIVYVKKYLPGKA